ncbi:MAG: competence/damage-inducible protein A [Fervidobacterium sp.]|uniref:competence/damage-inducible protein A n=1 Tax=Fervidobacterium sp. TaxID=1871331 RepID=UPI0030B040E1
MKNAIIYSIGNELVEGLIVDTNSKFLSVHLKSLGYNVIRIETLPDVLDIIVRRISEGLSEADLLITTGGLGPTEDDLTREAISKVLNKSLVLNEEIANELIERALKYYNKAPESVKKQALVLEGAIVLDNPVGTAPGQLIKHNGKTIVILPGPPVEMIPVFESIKGELKTDDELYTRRIKTIGVPEAVLIDEHKDLLYSNPQITIATMASYERGVEVRLTGSVVLKEEIDGIVEQLTNLLGESVYALDDDSIEDVVYKLLKENNLTISFAESCTGGLLSARFVDIPGVSSVYKGGVVAYSNESKANILRVPKDIIEKHGAVSEECVSYMAKNAREIFDSEFSVSISGIAGPTGGTPQKPVGTVCFAFASKKGVKAFTYNLRGDREMIRKRSALIGFDIARRGIREWLRLEGNIKG